MSQDRILGSMAMVQVYGPNGLQPFGELDSFDDEPQHELKNFKPLGQVEEHGQLVYKSYKLTFKFGKINGDMEQIQQLIDAALLAGQASPRFRIVTTTTWFSGNVETWIYDNALIYNLKDSFSDSGDAVGQDMNGWAPRKDPG